MIEPDNIASLALASLMTDKPFEPVFDLEGKRAKVDKIVLENETFKNPYLLPDCRKVGIISYALKLIYLTGIYNEV